MTSDSYDPTRDPRTGRPPLPLEAEKSRAARNENVDPTKGSGQRPADAIKTAVADLDQPDDGLQSSSARTSDPGESGGQRPEALAQLGQSARDGETSPKQLEADAETAPIPTENIVKHKVATKLLNDGARGQEPDPDAAGEDQLPDRITHTMPGDKE